MKAKSVTYVRKNTELSFVQHSPEFIAFYSNHEKLNVEIAGLKDIRFTENGVEKSVIITKNNFWFGIKRLSAFVINYLHYLNPEESSYMLRTLDELESEFSDDLEYSRFCKSENLGKEDMLKFNLLYFDYLLRCFNICNEFIYLLQSTLMISTKIRKKEIIYREDSPFFENIGRYREGISESLSNFKLVNILEHLKYVLGYYYTYGNLFEEEYVSYFDNIISSLKDEILNKDIFDMILKLSSSNSIRKNDELQIRNVANDLKRKLQLFYYYVNVLLRELNIFPNSVKRNNVDTVRNI